MKGLAVFDDEGVMRYAESDTYLKDGIIYSKVKEDHEVKLYKSQIIDNEITWLPLQREMTLDHQLQISFEESDKGPYMRHKGYERLVQGPIKTWILLSGELYLKR